MARKSKKAFIPIKKMMSEIHGCPCGENLTQDI